MATPTKYTFSVSTDFPNHKVDSSRLTNEIRGSSIITALDYINTSQDDCDVWFRDSLSIDDESALDAVVSVHSGEPLPIWTPPRNGSGMELVQVSLPEGRRCDVYTPNFCDKTTWYQDSLRVEDETLVDSGDHQTYNLATPCYVADVKHGKIFGEDNLLEDYGTVVTVDAVVKTENAPGETDGDYSVNYRTGAVTFKDALAGTEVVTLSYSKVRSSLCMVRPPEGQKMQVGYVEVQFAKNIGLTDTLIFQLWGDVGAGMMPLSGMEKYKTMRDFITDAEKAYPLIPTFDGTGDTWRMLTEETSIFRFDYTLRASTDLLSSLKMEIRVWLENDIPYVGDYAVGTFYGTRVVE